MNDFQTILSACDLTSAHGGQALAGHIRQRVLDAVHAVVEFPGEALQIRQSLFDDITAAPAGCLTQAVAELRALAAYLWTNKSARWGFGHTAQPSSAGHARTMTSTRAKAAARCSTVDPAMLCCWAA